jgi:hypothetical protein
MTKNIDFHAFVVTTGKLQCPGFDYKSNDEIPRHAPHATPFKKVGINGNDKMDFYFCRTT